MNFQKWELFSGLPGSVPIPKLFLTQVMLTFRFYLKGLFHPPCLARVVSLFASVAAIFMVHENGDGQRQAKR